MRRLGIPLISECNWFIVLEEEMLNYIFNIGDVACLVRQKVAIVLGIYNEEKKPWRVKLSLWFRGARCSTMIGLKLVTFGDYFVETMDS